MAERKGIEVRVIMSDGAERPAVLVESRDEGSIPDHERSGLVEYFSEQPVRDSSSQG